MRSVLDTSKQIGLTEMKTERGDMMREVLKIVHEKFSFDHLRDGPFCVIPAPYTTSAFIVWNFGVNRGRSLSKFIVYKSGWYTNSEEWFFEVLR